jgi:hypothetical protein
METSERLPHVAQDSLDRLATRYDPRVAQLSQGLQSALVPCAPTSQTFQQGAAWLRDIADIVEPMASQAEGGEQGAGQLRASLDTVWQ